jgi:hypothetical protein
MDKQATSSQTIPLILTTGAYISGFYRPVITGMHMPWTITFPVLSGAVEKVFSNVKVPRFSNCQRYSGGQIMNNC